MSNENIIIDTKIQTINPLHISNRIKYSKTSNAKNTSNK